MKRERTGTKVADKKYPWIKSIFKRGNPAAGVYAGPGMVNKNKNEPVEVVYAGPEIMPPPDMPVYAGPVPANDDAPVEDVYAGPRPFKAPDDPEEDAELPEKEADCPEKSVPAGSAPPQAPQNPANDPRMFMMVYAGPDYFADRTSGAPAFTPEKEDKVFCPDCGTPNGKENRFCVECGAKLVK